VQSYYTIIALDVARERSREAERRHLLDVARASDPAQQRSIRRSMRSKKRMKLSISTSTPPTIRRIYSVA